MSSNRMYSYGVGALALAWLLPFGASAEVMRAPDSLSPGQNHETIKIGQPKGFFSEKCLRLAAGTQIEYRFVSPKPVNFNVHSHVGAQTIYPVKLQDVQRYKSVLEIESAQEYCFMWTSRSDSGTSWTLTFDYSYISRKVGKNEGEPQSGDL